jgi:hypothetical protein
MAYHHIVKSFEDYADDIEAVNIHYIVAPIGDAPDWERQRSTRYMPPGDDRVRMKTLRLPLSITDSADLETDRYALHYYFEIFQGGDRTYSPVYSEEIVTTRTTVDKMVEVGADAGMATSAS